MIFMNNIEKAKLGTIGAITTVGIVGLPQMEAEARYRHCPPVIRHERQQRPINHKSIQEQRQEYYRYHRSQQNQNYDQKEQSQPQPQYNHNIPNNDEFIKVRGPNGGIFIHRRY
jgi:hypothetical protein